MTKRIIIVLVIAAAIVFVPYYVGSLVPLDNPTQTDLFLWLVGLMCILATGAVIAIFSFLIWLAYDYIREGI